MAQQPEKYLLLATNRTRTMQDELNNAGARGYRFAGTQGGETAFGGREAVVIVALDPEGRRFRYILLATNRTGTSACGCTARQGTNAIHTRPS